MQFYVVQKTDRYNTHTEIPVRVKNQKILKIGPLMYTLHITFTIYNCSSNRYMMHLYCLAVQAGFYSDVVECWPVMRTARVRSPATALVIRIFPPVTSGARCK